MGLQSGVKAEAETGRERIDRIGQSEGRGGRVECSMYWLDGRVLKDIYLEIGNMMFVRIEEPSHYVRMSQQPLANLVAEAGKRVSNVRSVTF